MIKKIILIISIVFLLLITFIIYNNYINKNLTINVNKFGVYDVYFYDIINEKKIDYGKRVTTFNGEIKINTNKLKSDEFNHQFLVIIESRGQIGIGTYSLINDESEYDVRQSIYKIYKTEYQYDKININLQKKGSPSKFNITNTEKRSHFLIVFYNEEESVYLGEGAFVINSIIDDEKIIGKSFVPNDFHVVRNESKNIYNTHIGQYFTCNIITFENLKQTYEIKIFTEFLGGLDHFPELYEIKYKKIKELVDLQFYPLD